MKKLFFILGILFTCLIVKAQDPVLVWDYATSTTPLGRDLPAKSLILVRSTGAIYETTIAFKATNTPACIVTDGHYKAYPMMTTGIVTLSPLTNGSGTVGTSSLRFLTGYINALTASTLVTSAAVTASTTLTLPGTTTITKTTGNGNSATFSHSAVVTDTLTSPVINASTKLYSPSVTASTTLTVGTLNITSSGSKVTADSLQVKRVLISDTLQGLVLKNSTGTKYRLRVSPTGVLTLIAVP